MSELCEETGKKCYGSKEKARHATKGIAATTRIYLCPFCKRWHLTRQQMRTDLGTGEGHYSRPNYRPKHNKRGHKIILGPDGPIEEN
jgi:hypothetical protein